MNFRVLILVCIFVSIRGFAFAQEGYTKSGFVNHNTLVANGNYGIVSSRPDMSEVRGDGLFWEDAMEGYVVFKNGDRTEKYLVNYDVLHNLLLFKHDAAWLNVETEVIDSIVMVDEHNEKFIMCVNETADSKPVLMHMMSDGLFSLYKMKKAKLKSPTYNAALNTGDKFHKVLMSEDFILCYEGNCFKLPNKTKKILKDKNMPSALKKYAKESGVKKLKKEKDVRKFAEAINTLANEQNPNK